MAYEVDIIYKDVIPSVLEYSRKASLGGYAGYCPQMSWTGGSGTATIEVSNDGVIWDTLPDSEKALAGDGSHAWNVERAFYAIIRVRFDNATGTTMKISLCRKVG